jgi:hypothetical protein
MVYYGQRANSNSRPDWIEFASHALTIALNQINDSKQQARAPIHGEIHPEPMDIDAFQSTLKSTWSDTQRRGLSEIDEPSLINTALTNAPKVMVSFFVSTSLHRPFDLIRSHIH